MLPGDVPMCARRLLAACLALAAVVLPAACATPGEAMDGQDVPPAASHAVQGDRLQALMRRLERLTTERLPRAIDPWDERRRRAERVRETARALTASAREIPLALETIDLDPRDREAFLALAGELERAAEELARADPDEPVEVLTERSRAIVARCDRCHTRFGIPMSIGTR